MKSSDDIKKGPGDRPEKGAPGIASPDHAPPPVLPFPVVGIGAGFHAHLAQPIDSEEFITAVVRLASRD